MSEAEWLAWRAEGITATDVARAVTGRYGGAYGVIAEKLGLVERGEVSEVMRRGHRWQQPIADAVHALTGLYVVGEETWCQHSADRWARATVDGFLAETAEAAQGDLLGVLEVKTRGVGVRADWGYWTAQVQWQLFVTGLDRAVLADAVIDDESDRVCSLHITELEADPDSQTIYERAVGLWEHLQDATLPDPDSPSALDAVKGVTRTADPDAEVVDLSPIASDVARFVEIKTAVKAAEDERDTLEARIRAAVGRATVGVCDGVRVSVSRPAKVLTRDAEETLLADFPHLAKTVLDRDRAKAEEPERYEAARQPVGARRLTIKETT